MVIAAAWLVWTQARRDELGLLPLRELVQPGQVYAFYAILQQWPLICSRRTLPAASPQAAGYAGLLLFVLRVPE